MTSRVAAHVAAVAMTDTELVAGLDHLIGIADKPGADAWTIEVAALVEQLLTRRETSAA